MIKTYKFGVLILTLAVFVLVGFVGVVQTAQAIDTETIVVVGEQIYLPGIVLNGDGGLPDGESIVLVEPSLTRDLTSLERESEADYCRRLRSEIRTIEYTLLPRVYSKIREWERNVDRAAARYGRNSSQYRDAQYRLRKYQEDEAILYTRLRRLDDQLRRSRCYV